MTISTALSSFGRTAAPIAKNIGKAVLSGAINGAIQAIGFIAISATIHGSMAATSSVMAWRASRKTGPAPKPTLFPDAPAITPAAIVVPPAPAPAATIIVQPIAA